MGVERPDGSSFPAEEWELLARYWHPVATSAEIDAGPVRSVLLDVPLVVWRTADNTAVVAADRCPHRGARLSSGTVADGVLQCPYHGICFGAGGQAVRVPSAATDTAIPSALDLALQRAEERYGLVWTCLAGAPASPLPDWSALDVPDRQRGSCRPDVWAASALRHTENFNDLAHFAFVHTKTFGAPDQTLVPPIEVELRGDTLVSELDLVQLDRETFDGPEVECDVHYTYRWTLPFCTELVIDYPRDRHEWICDVAAPVTASTCRVYVEKSRDHDLDEPLDQWITFQEAVNDEDREILAVVDPPAPGLVITGEVHVKADAASVAARRWFRVRLAELG